MLWFRKMLRSAVIACTLISLTEAAITMVNPNTNTIPYESATSLAEDVTGVQEIYDANATSTNPAATIFYTFAVTPVNETAKFTFDYNTGKVYIVADPQFDFETVPTYLFDVQAHTGDESSPTGYKFELSLTNVNEPPVITNLPDSVKINENDPGNYSIFTLITEDPDANTNITYSAVVTPPGTSAKFEFNKMTFENEVWLIKDPSLDFEQYEDYNISITASDGSLTSAPKFLHIEIRDVNERPVFTDTALTANLYEESPIGTTLATDITPIRALDPDTKKNDTVTYVLEGKYADYFDIQTVNQEAVITLAKRLDREDVNNPFDVGTFTLHVSAIDRLSLREKNGDNVDIVVTAIDIDDHPTVCNPVVYQDSVKENTVVNTTVLTLSCTDSDDVTTNPITYKINTTGQPDHYFWFPVNTNSSLMTRYPMDLEAGSMLSFVVDVVQGAPMNSSTTTVSVDITVVGENDNRPVMSQTFYNLEFRYDAAIGTQVGQISATDADVTSAVLSYDWVYAVTEFDMVTFTGAITTKQTYTAGQKYVYYGIAKDNDIPPDVSTASPIRIDTFDPTLYLIDFVVAQPVSYFTEAKQQEFEDAISSACPPCLGRISSLSATDGNSAMTTLTVYALTDSTTESYANVGSTKTYIAKATLLDVFTVDSAGTPSSAVALPGFFNFPVVRVTATPFGLTFLEWLLNTPEGNATLALAILSVVAALVGTLIYIWRTGAFSRLFDLLMACKISNMCKDCCKPGDVTRISHPKQDGDFNVFEFRYRNKPLVPKKAV